MSKRSQSTVQYYRKLIGEQKQSGQPVNKFCESRGIKVWCFYYWRKQLLDNSHQTPPSTPTFIPVRVQNTGNICGSNQMDLLFPKSIQITIPAMRKFLQAALEFSQAILS